jgi:hypothetical protein
MSILIVVLASSLTNRSQIFWDADMLPDRAEKHSISKAGVVLAGAVTHVVAENSPGGFKTMARYFRLLGLPFVDKQEYRS